MFAMEGHCRVMIGSPPGMLLARCFHGPIWNLCDHRAVSTFTSSQGAHAQLHLTVNRFRACTRGHCSLDPGKQPGDCGWTPSLPKLTRHDEASMTLQNHDYNRYAIRPLHPLTAIRIPIVRQNGALSSSFLLPLLLACSLSTR